MTNREWLSTLTDEQIAELYLDIVNCDGCYYNEERDVFRCNYVKIFKCTECISNWLKSEHKENNNEI